MANFKALCCSIFLTLLCLSAVGAQHIDHRLGKAETSPHLLQIAATFSGQVGVREASGKNDGPEVKKYLATVNLKEGYAWCGAFVNWVYLQHGIKGPKGAAMANAWFPKSRTVWCRKNDPQFKNFNPVTAFTFGIFYPHLNRIGHVGFIEKWDYGSEIVITVEGNTNGAGSREGNGVYRKRRLKKQIYAVAYWIT